METTARTITKALSWQVSGLFVMTLISYHYTGSLENAVSLASSSTLIGLACYFIHEKVWHRVRWGCK